MIALALERVPDVPERVDTRGMLLSGRAVVDFPTDPESIADGFVVSVPDAALVSVVGRPPRRLIHDVVERLDGDVNVLCPVGAVAYVAGALPAFVRAIAVLHTLSSVPEWFEGVEPDARVFTAADAPSLAHLPGALARELTRALGGRIVSRFVPGALPTAEIDAPLPQEAVPMAASWDGRVPVAFCYPVFRTESWWDVSVETVEDYRRRGHASRAARTMVRYMWTTGRAPVWGALESNAGSLTLAGALGFREVGRLAVLTEP